MLVNVFPLQGNFNQKIMGNTVFYISLFFVLTSFLAIYLFYRSTPHSRQALLVILVWVILQALVSMTGFYTITNNMPPRFSLLVLPPVVLILFLFVLPAGRRWMDRLDYSRLTMLHLVRVPVEIVLYALFLYKAVPKIMTFEGGNLDILSGLSAPLVFWLVWKKKKLGSTGLLFWNLICLGLLIHIVRIALFSAPFPFQRFGLDQPNIAVLYFPFVWLPGCIVPLVLFSHLASIRMILIKKNFIHEQQVPAV